MSTREQIESSNAGSQISSFETMIDIPACTIEDVDRSLFDLFDKQIPLMYTYSNSTKRVPVVFASGERFALLSRKKPLRDKAGALILPVISILRDSMTVDNEMGMSANGTVPHVIKKRLSKKDPRYQQLLNKLGLKNSDDLPDTSSFIEPDGLGSKNGRFASRRNISNVAKARQDSLLESKIGNNIFEIIEIPPPQFFTSMYTITIWAQYVQQMNEIISTIMTNMQDYNQRTFRLETKKGYTFVAYIDSDFGTGNNFDDFSDDERLIQTTFTVKIPGYLIGETYKGSPVRARSILSAPMLKFELNSINGDVQINNKMSNVKSADVNDYIDEDRFVDGIIPGQTIGGFSQNLTQDDTALIGGATNTIVSQDYQNENKGDSGVVSRTTVVTNPFGDEKSYLKTRTSRNGETVYREII